VRDWSAELRQRGQHRAFRVPQAVWDTAAQARIVALLAVHPAAPAPTPGPAPGTAELAAAATNLWAARRRLAHGDGGASLRQTGRYLRNCAEALAASGLVVQDHDGDLYHPGLALEVVEWVEDPALERETVVRTVRPTIYLHDASIRTGAVIVGHPADGDRRGEGDQ
jgi:hypothetical protein